MRSQTIADAERDTVKKMRPALKGLAALADATLQLAAKSVTAASAFQQRPTGQGYSLQVTALLVIRVMNDLRAALHLAHLGYPVQAAAVVAGLLELALTVAYIGVTDARADFWLKHNEPGTTPWRLRKMIPAVADRFDVKPDTLDQHYGLLCMLKHGNPMAERQRVIRDDETVELRLELATVNPPGTDGWRKEFEGRMHAENEKAQADLKNMDAELKPWVARYQADETDCLRDLDWPDIQIQSLNDEIIAENVKEGVSDAWADRAQGALEPRGER